MDQTKQVDVNISIWLKKLGVEGVAFVAGGLIQMNGNATTPSSKLPFENTRGKICEVYRAKIGIRNLSARCNLHLRVLSNR